LTEKNNNRNKIY